ncbi:flagellar hook-associated protein FlgK [Tumebacillus flagellatus]|uniref:Flagellar hook-associated protein 1 n=1 Tax=Tumebacillus flagellatus TaxID=1157490 RepID=A0A074LPK4_9BACL|nr:flagellar hook-associated protein FlgK [Tumebacillus flagellatus]KEO84066.1 hypothetical protein EL26_06275 [Tumebacillus flagellatus]
MTSTFHGLEIGKRALFAQQAGLNTVGQNVANANTPGYSRQRVDLVATPSMEYPGLAKSTQAGQLGTGVTVVSIERIRDSFLDAQYRNENKTSGEWEVRQNALDKLQAIFNEPSDTGLSKVLTNFYTSWQTLGRNPDSLEARSVVKQATLDLANTLNTMDAKLSELDSDLRDDAGTKVMEINQYTSQIVDLNKQIKTLEVLGDKANDLRDRRDYLVDLLSKAADTTAKELPDGTYQVSIGSTMVVDGVNPPVVLAYDSTTNTVNPPVVGGELGGMQASISQYVSIYRDQLNSLVNGLVNGKIDATLPNSYTFDSTVTTLPFDVKLANGTTMKQGDAIPAGYTIPAGSMITFNGLNGMHQFGFTMQKPTTQAGPLFETSDGSTTFTAGNIRLSKAITDDVRNLAASYTTYQDSSNNTQVKVGNGDVAFMLGEANSAKIDFKNGLPPNSAILTTGTVSDYMRAMIGQLGSQAQAADRQVKNQDTLLMQIDNQRQSISGVSIDEEMANMIKFQQSYGAAARLVNTIDGMLDIIINRLMSN